MGGYTRQAAHTGCPVQCPSIRGRTFRRSQFPPGAAGLPLRNEGGPCLALATYHKLENPAIQLPSFVVLVLCGTFQQDKRAFGTRIMIWRIFRFQSKENCIPQGSAPLWWGEMVRIDASGPPKDKFPGYTTWPAPVPPPHHQPRGSDCLSPSRISRDTHLFRVMLGDKELLRRSQTRCIHMRSQIRPGWPEAGLAHKRPQPGSAKRNKPAPFPGDHKGPGKTTTPTFAWLHLTWALNLCPGVERPIGEPRVLPQCQPQSWVMRGSFEGAAGKVTPFPLSSFPLTLTLPPAFHPRPPPAITFANSSARLSLLLRTWISMALTN